MTWRRIALLLVWTLSAMPAARAAEGGASLYLQGTKSDFGAGLFGPAGFYLRNDVFHYDAQVGPRPLGGRVAAETRAQTWTDLVKFAYLAAEGPFGARLGMALAVPVILNLHGSGAATAGARDGFRSGDVAGLGDIYIAPLQLNWSFGRSHLTLAPGIYAPTGSYGVDRLLNTSRNYWGFDFGLSYTWLDPNRGHEVSFTTGYLTNTRNNATDYRSGDQFHLDWLLGQHVSKHLAVAAVGYWYEQVTRDSGKLPAGRVAADGFRGSGVGIGPALLWTPRIGQRDVSVIVKWLHDVEARNRFSGDFVMLSAAFKF